MVGGDRPSTYPSIHFFVSRSRSVVDCARVPALRVMCVVSVQCGRWWCVYVCVCVCRVVCCACVLKWLCVSVESVCSVCAESVCGMCVLCIVVLWCIVVSCLCVCWCWCMVCNVWCWCVRGVCVGCVVCVVCVVCVCATWHVENPPCVGSKRLRVQVQNASVCTRKTRACCARFAGIHGCVLNLHTESS